MTSEEWKRRENYEKSLLNNMPLSLRRAFYPVMKTILKVYRVFSGRKIFVLNPDNESIKKPVIYAITHIGKFDVEICAEVMKRHFFLLSGDFENLHGNSSGAVLEINGVVYVDKFSREDRAAAKEKMVDVLSAGDNMMWFPEGIWNLTESLPVLPCVYGIIEVAKRTDAVILPVGIEQYGKSFYVNFGSAFSPQELLNGECESVAAKKAAVSLLRDTMAKLKWDIWETMPIEKRASIPDDYHENFVHDKLSEWSAFTYESVKAKEFWPPEIVKGSDVFEATDRLPLTEKTAFLAKHRGSW